MKLTYAQIGEKLAALEAKAVQGSKVKDPADRAYAERLLGGIRDKKRALVAANRYVSTAAGAMFEEGGDNERPGTGATDKAVAELVEKLKARGFTDAAIAGMVGNLVAESNFEAVQEGDPTIPGSRGGWGILQWTGSRRKAFESWVDENGKDGNNLSHNVDFLIEEMDGKHGGQWTGGGNVADYKKIDDPEQAAIYLENNYVRPGNPHRANRIRYSKDAFESLSNSETPDVKRYDEKGYTRKAEVPLTAKQKAAPPAPTSKGNVSPNAPGMSPAPGTPIPARTPSTPVYAPLDLRTENVDTAAMMNQSGIGPSLGSGRYPPGTPGAEKLKDFYEYVKPGLQNLFEPFRGVKRINEGINKLANTPFKEVMAKINYGDEWRERMDLTPAERMERYKATRASVADGLKKGIRGDQRDPGLYGKGGMVIGKDMFGADRDDPASPMNKMDIKPANTGPRAGQFDVLPRTLGGGRDTTPRDMVHPDSPREMMESKSGVIPQAELMKRATAQMTAKKQFQPGMETFGPNKFAQGAKYLAPMIDNIAAAGGIRNLEAPPAPVLDSPINLNNEYNINSALAENQKSVRDMVNGAMRNSGNASQVAATQAYGVSARIQGNNQLFGQKYNYENDSRNRETTLNAGINSQNTNRVNQYLQLSNQFRNNKTQMKAQNFANLGQDVQDVMANDRRYEFEKESMDMYRKSFESLMKQRSQLYPG